MDRYGRRDLGGLFEPAQPCRTHGLSRQHGGWSRTTRVIAQRVEQRAQISFVTVPALQRASKQRLADLNGAGGSYRPAGFVEADAAIVPGHAAIVDHPAGLTFQILDNVLISDIEHCAGWQNRAPMIHQFDVSAIVAAQLRQIVTEIKTSRE